MPNRRPSPPPSVKQYICDTALIKPWRSARLLAEILRGELVEAKRIDKKYGIKEETIRKYIEDARRNDPDNEAPSRSSASQKGQRVEKESPSPHTNEGQRWSLGATSSADIPLEVNSELLRISKWCYLAGRPFTIREAKWAIRLRTLVSSGHLLTWARRYALRERAWLAMSKQHTVLESLDTSDLDAQLWFEGQTDEPEFMPRWARLSAHLTGLFGVAPDMEKRQRDVADVSIDWLEMLYGEDGDPTSALALSQNAFDWAKESRQVKEKLAMSKTEADVFGIWARKLSEGPAWTGLTQVQKSEVFADLYADVYAAAKWLKDEYSDTQEEEVVLPGHWHPSEKLLEKVGYTLKDFERHISME